MTPDPNAPAETRLQGADASFQIFKGKVLQDQLALISKFSVTFEEVWSELPGGLEGGRMVPISTIAFTAHQDSPAYIDLLKLVLDGGSDIAISIHLRFPSGESRALVFEDLTFTAKVGVTGRHALVEAQFEATAKTRRID